MRSKARVSVFLVMAVAMLAATAAAEGRFIADKSTGCLAFVHYPQPDETIRWTGQCLEGKASGKGSLLSSNGTKLDGEFQGGKPYNAQGFETVLFNNGTRQWFNVSFTNGTEFLSGTIYSEIRDQKSGCLLWGDDTQTVTWTGTCVNGRASGKGIATWTKNSIVELISEGEYVDGWWPRDKFRTTRKDGTILDGGFKDGGFNGEPFFGKITWRDGTFFEGEFRLGKLEGGVRELEPYNAKGMKWIKTGTGEAKLLPVTYENGRDTSIVVP